jgi:hypothetical protein
VKWRNTCLLSGHLTPLQFLREDFTRRRREYPTIGRLLCGKSREQLHSLRAIQTWISQTFKSLLALKPKIEKLVEEKYLDYIFTTSASTKQIASSFTPSPLIHDL